jgi:hypothetical protein
MQKREKTKGSQLKAWKSVGLCKEGKINSAER